MSKYIHGHDIILDVKNLSTHFHTQDGLLKAVDDISFYLRKGEVLGIVGESGSGKSVAVMSLLGLIPQPPGEIVEGKIIFDGKDIAKYPPKQMQKIRGNRISMIFQDPMTSLNPYMRISHQIMETLILHKGMNKSQSYARTVDLLKKVGINDAEKKAHNYPHEFSGGMRQRAMIAMALACEPDILIADEPTTALDVSVQIQTLALIKELIADLGTAVIFITHDLGVVANMCDRVHVMYAGRIIEDGEITDIFERTKHPYTQGLLDSVTQLYQQTEGALKIIEGQPPILIDMPDACLFYPRCAFAHENCLKKRPDRIEVEKNHFVECVLYEDQKDKKNSM